MLMAILGRALGCEWQSLRAGIRREEDVHFHNLKGGGGGSV